MRVVVGVGASRGCPAEELAELVDQALDEVDRPAVHALATVDLKADEPAITQLATARGWPLHLHTAAELAAVDVPTPSEVVQRHVGTPSVAEAAALLTAGATELLLPKRRSRHGTCALAVLLPR